MSDPPADAAAALVALAAAGLTAATAESLTGGLVVAALTAVPGSSAVVRGGIVAYDVAAKQRLLGVPGDLLRRHGPVHPEVAAWMARGAGSALQASAAVATTGVAGPQGHGGEPPGVVFVGWRAGAAQGVVSARFAGDRGAIRTATTALALQVLRHCAERGEVAVGQLGGPGGLSDAGVTIEP